MKLVSLAMALSVLVMCSGVSASSERDGTFEIHPTRDPEGNVVVPAESPLVRNAKRRHAKNRQQALRILLESAEGRERLGWYFRDASDGEHGKE